MEPKDFLKKITEGKSLSEDESKELADLIMEGSIPESLVGAILVGLRMKGETPEEIIGFTKSMREHALKLEAKHTLDTAGTGGDGFGTINVSTASALAVSLVYPVAKHGNRAASSKSGSADFLEAVGYNIQVPPERAKRLIEQDNFAFLFAQLYHPSMKNVAPVRKALGIRTIFNILGPLTNPAGSERQVMGVFSRSTMKSLSIAATRLSFEKLLLIHGEPGIDEVSPQGRTYVIEVSKDRIDEYVLDFKEITGKEAPISRLIALDPADSVKRVIRGSKGVDKDVEYFLRINVDVALYAAGLVKDFKEGYELSEELIRKLPSKIESVVKGNGDLTKFQALVRSI
ncbi:MAG: anthranilate phosphoribosyltransferase [Metallosphaera sp.]